MKPADFADCCPKCLEGPFEPHASSVEGESIVGTYECGACGHRWSCSWHAPSFPAESDGAALEAQFMAQWRATLAELRLEDCYFRMMAAHEIGRGCGFDVDFSNYSGTFIVWGSARNQVDGFGNAVSPQVGAWIGARLRAVIHTRLDRGPDFATAA